LMSAVCRRKRGRNIFFPFSVRATVLTRRSRALSARLTNGVDKLAVVDPELRVHGILGLRVADASVMPQIITGPGTNASTHMIAGRAAKLILG